MDSETDRTITLNEAAFAAVQEQWRQTIGTLSEATVSLRASRPMQQAATHEPPCRRVGDDEHADYRLYDTIGQGGMGVVHWASQRGLARRIALKRLRSDKMDDPLARLAFVTEALVTAQLEHPNIVTVHELCVDADGRPFYLMKPVHGRAWSRCRHGFSLARNLDILLTVCDAVAYAHSRGVLHRDLKPGNIMIGSYGEVVVMDWGLAVAVPDHADSPAPSLAGLQGEPAIGGTPAYMPPEMALGQGDRIDIRSDVYLLGAILFELLHDEPPHDGDSVLDCLRHAAGNQLVTSTHRGELAAIANKALATEPADRYSDVAGFRASVSDYRAHAESMQLSERAAERLDLAMASSDYDAFARALYGFEEALGLWSGNRRALRGRQEARWAYATAALEKNDLDLAASLIGDEPEGLEDLAQQLQQARARRQQTQQAERRLARVEAQRHRESDRKWHCIAAEDFQDDSFHQRWQVHSINQMWSPGELRLWGGSPALIIYRDQAPGDVRLSFEIRLEGSMLNDISCFLAASSGVAQAADLRKQGYEFKYGAYENTRVCLYRSGVLVYDRRESPLEYGRTYRVETERIGQVLRMRIDGEQVLEWQDDEVLAGGRHHVVGIVAWGAEYCYSNLRIDRLGAPLKADLLDVAADHLSRGHINTAVDLYEDVHTAAVDPDRRRQAQDGLKRTLQLRSLSARIPGFQRRIHEAWPEARVRLVDDGLVVNIAGLGIEDLEPLRGMPLRSLDCSHNRIQVLDPLADMPLRELRLADNRVRSVEPLRGSPLVVFDCRANRVKSLAPLAELPLEELDCPDNRIADLSPLRRLRLTQLDCSGNSIGSLSPLAEQPLVRLTCDDNLISDLSPLAHSNLAQLSCARNQIDQLTVLASLPLKQLDCSDNPITSLAPVSGLVLDRLCIVGTEISDITALHQRPPLQFEFATPCLSVAALQAAAMAWEGDPVYRPLAHQAWALSALRAGDQRLLQKLARPIGLQRVVYLPEPLSFAAARRRARQLGSGLCCPAMPEEDLALRLLMPPETAAWIGLPADAERWDDGRSVEAQHLPGDPVDGGVLWSASGWRRIPSYDKRRYGWLLAW